MIQLKMFFIDPYYFTARKSRIFHKVLSILPQIPEAFFPQRSKPPSLTYILSVFRAIVILRVIGTDVFRYRVMMPIRVEKLAYFGH